MKETLKKKLDQLLEKYHALNDMLAGADIYQDTKQLERVTREHKQLSPIVKLYTQYLEVADQGEEVESMMNSGDEEMKLLAQDEFQELKNKRKDLFDQIQIALLPQDPDDEKNIYLEIRAGTGGDEAALFVGDLFRMYQMFAEHKGWQVKVVQQSPADQGGYKEIIVELSGDSVYGQLKFESGGHRVQRVPQTESQGRIHTSACTVAVMPKVDEIEEVDINPADLKVDTYRSSGAGGQHVNTTDSAVRITHLPTGVVVECQDERSQHKNRAKAMALLQSRILAKKREDQQKKQASTRRLLVGSGDRSERIRTYNFPQGRVTDHRIHLTLHKLPEILTGNLAELIDSLLREDQADQLASLDHYHDEPD
ncbi:MAG TPA: peptide chain release factor 1 [Gammaproteobacteria bacterium]|nr:peptide chain release factor 1 [Gammaproteobacteria bacterium]